MNKTVFQSKLEYPQMCVFISVRMTFLFLYYLHLVLVTLTANLTKNEVSEGQGFQKLQHEQDKHTRTYRQTDATEHITSRIRGR